MKTQLLTKFRRPRCFLTANSRKASLASTFLFILGLLTINSSAADIVINSGSSNIDLTSKIEYLEDHNKNITITHLLANSTPYHFSQSTQASLNFGYTKSAYWLRWKVTYDVKETRDWFLTIADPLLDHADVYVVKPNGTIVVKQAGQLVPQSKREIKGRSPIFRLEGKPKTTDTIYLRVASGDPLQLSLSFLSSLALIDKTFTNTALVGSYYGIMLVMLLYNLFIFSTLREKSYLFYCIYLGCLIPAQMSFDGLSYQILWPESTWWSNRSAVFFSGAVALAGTQFARVFLNTRLYTPLLDKLLLIHQIAAALVIPCSLTYPYEIAATGGVGIAVSFAVMMLSTAIIGYLQNLPNAKYFMIAWLTFTAGILIRALTATGQLEVNSFTLYSAQFGTALETVLLSFALADRINRMQRDKREAQLLAAQALEQSNTDLKASNKVKDEFLATISHELRTPMNGIQGMLDLIKSTPLSTKQQEYVKYANISTHEMLSHINVLLCFSEAQSKRLSIKSTPFQLMPMLDELADTYERLCSQKFLEFHFRKGEHLPNAVYGDPSQLRAILNNLLDNATKFTEAGYVEFCVSVDKQHDADQLGLRFDISDTGPGITASAKERLFQPFCQADSSHSRRHGGLGIGLALSSELAELMGGNIQFRESHPKGSNFSLSLTFTQAEETLFHHPMLRNQEKLKSERKQKSTILIVEDNKVNQTLLKAILTKRDFSTLTASNGEEALRVLTSNPVDLILMDCQMPVMDGFETTRIIRERHATYGYPPIIAVTANALSEDREKCINAGMNEYLTKPIDRYKLYKAIDDWLGRKVQSPNNIQRLA
ncbi:hypothetical protein A9Q99_20065 [Gammaproteobacteria bacterium 45_16_T64]|nr:hypothetical protein A9Q99_20065 [Gammaproteobacteria bacterium 45_16_T64]